jgi:uncharacterized membrane protein
VQQNGILFIQVQAHFGATASKEKERKKKERKKKKKTRTRNCLISFLAVINLSVHADVRCWTIYMMECCSNN